MHECTQESGEVRPTCLKDPFFFFFFVEGQFWDSPQTLSELCQCLTSQLHHVSFTVPRSCPLGRDEGMIRQRLELRPPIDTTLLRGMSPQDYTENHKWQMTLSNYFHDFEHLGVSTALGSSPTHDAVHEAFLLTPHCIRAVKLRIPTVTNNNNRRRKFRWASELSFPKWELKCFLTPRHTS